MTFSRVRPTVAPSKGTEGSAGLDIYLPNFDEKFLEDVRKKNTDSGYFVPSNAAVKNSLIVYPKKSIVIPLGLKFNIPTGFGLFAFNKSGVVFKQTIVKLAEVIDSDYQGEVFLSIWNYSEFSSILTENQKIIQLVLLDLPYYTLTEVEEKELYYTESVRGEGAMGSTGLHNE